MRLFSLPALAVCAAGLLFSSVASAQSKVGVINFQKALLDTGELKKAANELQSKYKKRQDDLEKLQRELNDLQADVDNDRNAVLQKSGQRMTELIKKIAEDKGLDLVVDVQSTYFFKPVMDITVDATTAYDKAFPVK